MAIGTTAAILGSAALGAGASLASAGSQSSAARQQSQVAQQTSNEQVNLYRDVFNQQRSDFEPFRQSELRRSGLVDRILGIPAPAAPTAGAAPVAQATQTPFSANPPQEPFGRRPAPLERESLMRGGPQRAPDLPLDGRPSLPGLPGGQLPALDPNKNQGLTPQLVGGAQPVPQGIVAGQPNPELVGQSTPVFDPNIAGATEFNNSLFASALQANNRRDLSAIDQNLASQGLAFSGAQMEATANAVTQNTQSGLNSFLATLLGAPSAGPATQGTAAAGQNFAAQTGNAIGNRGIAQQQSAFNQGQSQADLFGNLATAGGSALGAFSLGGKK